MSRCDGAIGDIRWQSVDDCDSLLLRQKEEEEEYRGMRVYERRRHPSDVRYDYDRHHPRYDNGEVEMGLDETNTDESRSNVDDYDTFDADVVHEESYREPRTVVHDANPSQLQPESKVKAVVQQQEPTLPSPHQQLETHINYNTVPGTPGVDYPNHAYVPLTTFYCYNHQHPGYYADVEAGCQVFHVCDVDGRQDSFLCPKGTIFNQAYFICDWWFNVDCGHSPDYYGANADLHKDQSVQSRSSSSSSSSNIVASYSDATEL